MTKRWMRMIAVVGLTAALLAGVRLLAHYPSGSPPADGVVRLAWRMAGEKVKLCRKFTQAELARVLPHMRRPENCREHLLSYGLRVTLNARERVTEEYAPPGASGDRPLFIHQDLRLDPGTYVLGIQFSPVLEGVDWDAVFGELSEKEAVQLRASLERAARPTFHGSVRVRAGRIVLVELNESTRQFVVREG